MLKQLQKLSAALKRFNINDIDRLISYAQQQFQFGDEIKIISGRYTGMRGTIADLDLANDFIDVEIEVFGRRIPATLRSNEIELISRNSNPEEVAAIDPNENFQILVHYIQEDPLKFIQGITPIFDQLDNQKTGLVERVVEQETENIDDILQWEKAVGPFLIANPEYLNEKLMGTNLFEIIARLNKDSALLRAIPESLLFEVWNKSDKPIYIAGMRDILRIHRVFNKLLKLFPNFMNTLGFFVATNEPSLYLENNLDEIFHEQINKEDVVETLFNKDAMSFLLNKESDKYPELERRAVYKLIYNADSQAEDLALFFNSPKNYWAQKSYQFWTIDAVRKFVGRYSQYLNYLNSSFLETDFGKNMGYQMALNVIKNKDYRTFFAHFLTHYPSLGEQVAKQMLEDGTPESINIFDDYHLMNKYPNLMSTYQKLQKTLQRRLPETREEEQARWDREDMEREERYQRQNTPPISEVEPPDPDFEEHFERGQ